MTALLTLAAGTGLGFILKWLADLLGEQRQQRRDDEVWRRERFMDAAADLLEVCWEMVGASSRVGIAVFSLSNAERANMPQVLEVRELLDQAYAEHRPLPPRANRALEVLRLYASPEVIRLGVQLRDQSMLGTATPGKEMREQGAAAQECADRFVAAVRVAAGVSSDKRPRPRRPGFHFTGRRGV